MDTAAHKTRCPDDWRNQVSQWQQNKVAEELRVAEHERLAWEAAEWAEELPSHLVQGADGVTDIVVPPGMVSSM